MIQLANYVYWLSFFYAYRHYSYMAQSLHWNGTIHWGQLHQ